MPLPLKPGAVLAVAREINAAAGDFAPLLVAGAPETAEKLVDALSAGAEPAAVRNLSGRELGPSDLEGAYVLVYAIEGDAPDDADLAAFRLADRRDVEIVCVLAGEPADPTVEVPYVLATDVVRVALGEELPIAHIADRIAERAGTDGYRLAARAPVLRRPIAEEIVRDFARQNGVLSVLVFIPGADFPVLTLNQIRMVLRLATAYGEKVDGERAFELLSVVGVGLGLRAVARNLVGVVPGLGWAVKGAIAFVGTRAMGEAAIAYFEADAPERLKRAVRSRS